MKKAYKIPIPTFEPKKNDTILLDTNILINLFYPINFGKDDNRFDLLYQKLIKANSDFMPRADKRPLIALTLQCTIDDLLDSNDRMEQDRSVQDKEAG